ncbi:MAG: HU family DNA-binding protein [Paracoccaceae bacterium]|nr:HU family DNA-binding protein [Paracoccaceae bacterium]
MTGGEERINKAGSAGRLGVRAGQNKAAAKKAVDCVFAVLGEALANGEEVRLAGFEAFGIKRRPAGTGRNPRTGAAVSISTSPTFKVGKTLKDAVNAGPAS